MEKTFCAVFVLVALSSLSESRTVTDRRFNKFGRFDLDGLWGNDFGMKKTVIEDGEEYLFGSCEILPASAWSAASGIIEFRQKAGSALEMSVNITGLSNTVPFYKLQVYTSGEVLDGCGYAGEPYSTDRYSGHLADITATNQNGDVELDLRNVAATLFGDDCIFGRSIQITDYEGKEPEACCIIVHDLIEDLKQDEEPTEVAEGDEITGVAEETDNQDELAESDSSVKDGKDEPVLEGAESNEPGPMLIEDEESLTEEEEAGWSAFVESVFTEAEKEGIDPNTITDITDLSNSVDEGGDEKEPSYIDLGEGNNDENPSNLLDVVFKAAKDKDIPFKAISKVNDLSKTMDNFDLSDLQNNGETLFERKKLDLSNMQSLDILSKGEGVGYLNNQAGTEEDADWSSIMKDIMQDAKKNNIPEESILKIELDELDTGDTTNEDGNNWSDLINEIMQEAKKNNISEESITKIVESSDSNAMPSGSESNEGELMENTDWSNLMEQVLEEAKKNNISEDSILKVLEIADSNNMDEGKASDIQTTDWSEYVEEIMEEARKQNISEESIIKIVELAEGESPWSGTGTGDTLPSQQQIQDSNQEMDLQLFPDGTQNNAGDPENEEDWSNLVEEAIREANNAGIPSDAITKIELGPADGKTNELNDVPNGGADITEIDGDGAQDSQWSDLVDQVVKEAAKEGIPPESITQIVEEENANDGV